MGKIKDGVNVGGRPDKLTSETLAVILEALQKHNYVSTACELAGISETTFYNWIDKGEHYKARLLEGEDIGEEGGRFVGFLEQIKGARAGSEAELLGRIDTAGSVAVMIEKRTIEHRLKDGSTKVETIERMKPPEWQANAWMLERTRPAKFGQHATLDIHQEGVIFLERLQRARDAKVIEGEFREIEEIANEPIAEEVPGQPLIDAPHRVSEAGERLNQAPARRPMFELIARKRGQTASGSHKYQMYEPSQGQQPSQGDGLSSQDGSDEAGKNPGGG